MKPTKTLRQYELVATLTKHAGENVSSYSVAVAARRLLTLGKKWHRITEEYCNGSIDDTDAQEVKILVSANKCLGELGVSGVVKAWHDPRGTVLDFSIGTRCYNIY